MGFRRNIDDNVALRKGIYSANITVNETVIGPVKKLCVRLFVGRVCQFIEINDLLAIIQ
jgi:hypothetical protein